MAPVNEEIRATQATIQPVVNEQNRICNVMSNSFIIGAPNITSIVSADICGNLRASAAGLL